MPGLLFRLTATIALASLPLCGARAQDPMPWLEDGRSCFCLHHDSGQVIRNCTGTKPAHDFVATATCRGQDPAGPITTLAVRAPWTPIKAADPGCDPCRPKPPSGGIYLQVPRE